MTSDPSDPASPEEGLPELQGLDPKNLIADCLNSAPVETGWEPPTAEHLARLLPQYEIEKLIGHGGMGAVYKGTQGQLERAVAIKILPSEIALDEGFIERFKREARTLARLQHPNIVAVYDFGQTREGHLYFVMEFVAGTDLLQIIKGPGLDAVQALGLTIQVCEALQYAHSQGVTHRDVKPANVLITPDGRAKLADFGLARPTVEEHGSLTASNIVLGTPDYMAPEQRAGLGDHRADIYALGVMLYEMLTGTRPAGVFDPPSFKVQVDVRLDAVVLKAMQQEPERRYQLVSEMGKDVDHIRSTPMPRVAQPVSRSSSNAKTVALKRPRRKKSATPLSFAILAVIGVLGFMVIFALEKGWFHQGAAQSSLPLQRDDSATSSTQPKGAAATSRVIDLLPLMDASRDAISGNWTIKGGELILAPGSKGASHIRLPHTIATAEYDIEFEFSSLGDKEVAAGLRFPVGGKLIYWAMNVFKDFNDRYYGFLSLDGQQAARSTEARIWRSSLLPPHKHHHTAVKVRTNSLTGVLDGDTLVHWEGDLKRFQETMRTDPRFPIIHSDEDGIIIYKATITEFAPPSAAPQPSPTANVPHDLPISAVAAATKDAPFVNSLGMKFVPVPITGGPTGGQRVLFSIWETRVQDYGTFATETKREWPKPDFEQGPTHPAVMVSWHDATAFCVWLTNRERKAGRLGTNEVYRLPSDHEWSCAVGIGDREDPAKTPKEKLGKIVDVYPWGTTWPPPPNAGNYPGEELKPLLAQGKYQAQRGLLIAGRNDGYPNTAPVGSFLANPLGLYDLGGNAAEWCEDLQGDGTPGRVKRGSEWGNGLSKYLISSQRDRLPPASRNDASGFRVVLGTPTSAPPTTTTAATAQPGK